MSAPRDPLRHRKSAKRLVCLVVCGIVGLPPAYETAIRAAYDGAGRRLSRPLVFTVAIFESYLVLGICLASGILIGVWTHDKTWPRVISIIVYFVVIWFVFCLLNIYTIR